MTDENFVALEMIKTVNKIKRLIDEQITMTIDKNLTVSQAHVIGYVFNNGDKKDIFQKDIEKVMGLQRSSVSLMLNNMEKSGFIQRLSSSEDARLKKIVLTQNAIQLQKKITLNIYELNNKFFKDIPKDKQKIFLEVLHQIYNNAQ